MQPSALPGRPREVNLWFIPQGFLLLILVGAFLLVLPITHAPGRELDPLDAVFLSTSAACVTGLTTVNVAETLNTFGHIVLLGLIQIGGLGIMTAGTFFLLLTGSRLSLAQERSIVGTIGRLRSTRPVDIFIYACVIVFLSEAAGVVALFALIAQNWPEQSPNLALWQATFHSVSAFCNAGISIFPEGMVQWRNHPLLLGVIDLLVVAGGIGLLTLVNLRFYYWWRRDSRRRGQLGLQTRLSVLVALILLGGGALLFLLLELNRTLAGVTWHQRLSWALFHSAMTRTAGFSVVDLAQMHPASLLLSMILMFIGGAPGSMAGGIKTITAAVLLLTAWTALRRRPELTVLGRRVPRDQAGVAIMITLLAAGALLLGITLLMLTENGQPAATTSHHWLAVAFEAVSAFGTVGLSTGITPLLTPLGKILIVLLMFTGRVGPLMLAMHLCRPQAAWHVRHPEESVSLG